MSQPSEKSRAIALAFAGAFGVFGAHRFYVGKTGTGILMALTIGGFGIWYLIDVITIASGGFRDAEGLLVSRWEAREMGDLGVPKEIMDEIYALRNEVNELHERVDFTERLLSDKSATRTESQTGA